MSLCAIESESFPIRMALVCSSVGQLVFMQMREAVNQNLNHITKHVGTFNGSPSSFDLAGRQAGGSVAPCEPGLFTF